MHVSLLQTGALRICHYCRFKNSKLLAMLAEQNIWVEKGDVVEII